MQLCQLQNIHSCSFIHRDIKPSNILIGTSQQASTIYLINFSIVTLYRDPSTHHHNTFKECCGSLGSPVFSSINSDLGFELGMWDDIEALVYVLLYFACGSLPWLGHTPCLERDAIASMKQDILQHDDIPKALVTMLSYTQSLSFMQKPDYNYLWTLVKGLCTDPLDLTTWLEWLCGDNTPSVYKSRPLVGGDCWRYLHIWHLVFETRLMIEY